MDDLFRDVFLAFVRIHLLHHADEAPIYGVEMIDELARHGYSLSPGTLYPILHAMEAGGYLQSNRQVVGGKVRKYYAITDAGRTALGTLQGQVRELVDEVLGKEHSHGRATGNDPAATGRSNHSAQHGRHDLRSAGTGGEGRQPG